MSLKKIRLELARDKDFPAGSTEHGYEFIAPLDRNGRIDTKQWESRREKCRVVRFWGTDEREHGYLVRKPETGLTRAAARAADKNLTGIVTASMYSRIAFV